MFKETQKFNLFILLLTSIYIAAWVIQNQLFLNWDVSQLFHTTKLMLAGGTYVKDFFIPNPPMILYLYTPPVFISHFFNLNIVPVFQIYIFLLATISLWLCHLLIKHIFSKQDMLLAAIFFVMLAAVFLLLPLYEFGQREHLLILFAMPYLLTACHRLQGGTVSTVLAFFIGLLAGIGFSIKPHFLVMPLFIEFYFIFHSKHWLGWTRIETLTMIGLFAIYLIVLLVFYQNLLFIIMPYLASHYYTSNSFAWNKVLNAMVYFCCLPILLHLILYRRNPYKILSTLLTLTLISFIILYITQRTPFYYHLIPALSTAVLLFTLLFSWLCMQPSVSKRVYVLTSLLGILLFLSYRKKLAWTTLTFYPKTFFIFFGILFIFLLYLIQHNKNIFKASVLSCIIVMISLIGSYLAQHTSWHTYQIHITLFLLLATFGLIASHLRRNILHQAFIAALAILIFAFPAYNTVSLYLITQNYRSAILNKLIAFMHTQPTTQSIYALSIGTNISAPLTDYVNVPLAQHFDCLWMVNGLAQKLLLPNGEADVRQYIRGNKEKNFFINVIADDLHTHHPDIIFVDARHPNTAKDNYFDFISYFLENKKFREEWKSYHYLTTITGGAYRFKIDVYKRVGIQD